MGRRSSPRPVARQTHVRCGASHQHPPTLRVRIRGTAYLWLRAPAWAHAPFSLAGDLDLKDRSVNRTTDDSCGKLWLPEHTAQTCHSSSGAPRQSIYRRGRSRWRESPVQKPLDSPDGEPKHGKPDQRRAGEQPGHQQHQRSRGGLCPPLRRRRLPRQRAGSLLGTMVYLRVLRSQPTLSGVPPLRAPILCHTDRHAAGLALPSVSPAMPRDLPGTRPSTHASSSPARRDSGPYPDGLSDHPGFIRLFLAFGSSSIDNTLGTRV